VLHIKKDGMINITIKKCKEEGCKIIPNYNYEGQTNNGEHLISNSPVIKLTFDKPSHRIRETASLTVEVTAGKFSLSTVTETVSAPDLSYTGTESHLFFSNPGFTRDICNSVI
jgi:hypothetical protein